MFTLRPLREHVIEPAEADVVGPAVAADDPDALAHQVVGERSAAAGRVGSSMAASCALELGHALALRVDLVLGRLSALEQRLRARSAPIPARAPQQLARACSWCLSSARRIAEPELGVVLEQRVAQAGPRPSRVDGPRRRRQVAAVDRRAAGGVGDQQPVAEELREQLEIRRFAAAGARARELEQRLRGTARSCTERRVDPRGRASGSSGRTPSSSRSRVAQRRLRLHVERLVRRLRSCPSPGRRRRRACSRCSPRARPGSCSAGPEAPRLRIGVDLKPAGAPPERRGVVDLGADRRVRADHRALAALDAESGSQTGISARCCASPMRGAGGERAVDRQRAHRQPSPRPAIIAAVTSLNERRAHRAATSGAGASHAVAVAGPATSCRCASVASTAAKFPHDRLAPLPYVFSIACLICAIASSRGSTPADREEARLHDRVDAAAHPASRATLRRRSTKNAAACR